MPGQNCNCDCFYKSRTFGCLRGYLCDVMIQSRQWLSRDEWRSLLQWGWPLAVRTGEKTFLRYRLSISLVPTTRVFFSCLMDPVNSFLSEKVIRGLHVWNMYLCFPARFWTLLNFCAMTLLYGPNCLFINNNLKSLVLICSICRVKCTKRMSLLNLVPCRVERK